MLEAGEIPKRQKYEWPSISDVFNVSYLSERTDYGALADAKCFDGKFKGLDRESIVFKCSDSGWVQQRPMHDESGTEEVSTSSQNFNQTSSFEDLICVRYPCGELFGVRCNPMICYELLELHDIIDLQLCRVREYITSSP